jgi:hypothetical protein
MAVGAGVKVPTRSKKVKIEEAAKTVVSVKDEIETVETEKIIDEFVEHQKKAITEATKAVESLIPEGFKKHGEAALKEMVEGYRNLFNSAIDEIVAAIERVRIEEKDGEKKI